MVWIYLPYRFVVFRAKREAQILSKVKNENIVRVYGITTWSSYFAIVMELVMCGNLEDLLYNKNIPTILCKLKTKLFLEIVNAINYLHNHDPKRLCIHGDLKPQNILLTETLAIKLADFGAAAICQAAGAKTLTTDKSFIQQNTPLYLAPEFLVNHYMNRTPEMDIYR